MVQRPHQGKAVAEASLKRKQLADVEPGGGGADGAERAPVLRGGVGLQDIGHRLERSAEVDQQPVPVIGFDQPIFFEEIVEWRKAGHALRPSIASGREATRSRVTGCFPCRP